MFKPNDIVTDGITAGVEYRKQRGIEIAKVARIDRKGETFLVPSMSGNGRYVVNPAANTCTCPDHATRGCKCKHLYAVEMFVSTETTENADGSTTVTETVAIKATKRTTYPQNWPAYNAAQTTEKDHFQSLLFDLCKGIQTPAQQGRGQRRLPLSDAVFSVCFKVYSTVSQRRFMCDLSGAKDAGYIDAVPHFNSISNYLENEELTAILTSLIVESSKPLATIESDFAADSSGFTSCRFHRWFDHKYGTVKQEHDWVKVHVMTGVKTNVVTAVEIGDKLAQDAPMLPPLLNTTAKNFTVAEVSADKAYASVDNFNAIDKVGAMPFIPFKSNHTGKAGGLFKKAFHFFCFNQDEFLAHYHKRSNVESTFSMIKAKFGDAVRSKTDTAMKNEALCKILCHNLCCLISAFHELGIEADFGRAA
jgi:transposase